MKTLNQYEREQIRAERAQERQETKVLNQIINVETDISRELSSMVNYLESVGLYDMSKSDIADWLEYPYQSYITSNTEHLNDLGAFLDQIENMDTQDIENMFYEYQG